MDNIVLITQHSEKLADMADELLSRVPISGDWGNVRRLLARTSDVLKRGDVRTGLHVFQRVAKYLQALLASTDKTIDLNGTYQIVENINSHFLVDQNAKHLIEDHMMRAGEHLTAIKKKLEDISGELDFILFENCFLDVKVSWRQTLSLAFKFNRLSADIKSCEKLLSTIKLILCELDTHVGTKKFFAVAVSWLSAVAGIVAFGGGNAVAGGICFSLAKATDKTSKDLQQYKDSLHKVNAEHVKFEQDLYELKSRYFAETKNFSILVGAHYLLPLLLCIIIFTYFAPTSLGFVSFLLCVTAFLVMYREELSSTDYLGGFSLTALAAYFVYSNNHMGMLYLSISSIVLTVGMLYKNVLIL